MEHLHRHRLKQLGFVRLKSDVGIYVKGKGEEAVYIALYVDDLFMLGIKLVNIEVVKRGLGKEFKMKDLGEARFLLGLRFVDGGMGMFFLFKRNMHEVY